MHPFLHHRHRFAEDGVTLHRNLAYRDPADPRHDRIRSLLDLYLPPGARRGTDRPMLLLWIHGGGWRIGSKDDLLGLYGRVCRSLAAESGIAVANLNYRLTPKVRHPEHVRDVAAALSWLRQRADDYGYDPNRMVLAGHSAGAHLASLVALDRRWLREADGSEPDAFVRGVVASSGLYRLSGLDEWLTAAEGARRRREVPSIHSAHPLGRESGMPFHADDLGDASPLRHVRDDAPPFVLIHEEHWPFMRDEALRMASALEEAAVPHEIVEVAGHNHTSMLVDMLVPDNAAVSAIRGLVERVRTASA